MGQLASNLGNSNITDPKQAQWGDMDNSERGARLLSGGMRGLGQGMQGMSQQSQGGAPMPVPMPQQPQIQLPGMTPEGQQNNPFKIPITKPNPVFYGQ